MLKVKNNYWNVNNRVPHPDGPRAATRLPDLHVQFSRKLEHVLHPRNRLPQLVARAIYTLRRACLTVIPSGLQMRLRE